MAIWHLQLINCDDLSMHSQTQTTNGGLQTIGVGQGSITSPSNPLGSSIHNSNPSNTNLNQLAGNSSLLNTLMQTTGNVGLSNMNGAMGPMGGLGSVGSGSTGLLGHPGGGGGGGVGGAGSSHGVSSGGGMHHHGHALAGLASLGIIVPGHRGSSTLDSGGRYNPSYMGSSNMDLIGGMQQGGVGAAGGSQY